MSTTPVLHAERLCKRFGSKEVLRSLTLKLLPGQIVGLLGSNGSGKTTLIKCLLGLLKPNSGTSSLLGEPSWQLSATAKERLGYVPQEIAILPWMTVQSYADYVGAFYQHWDRQRVKSLMKNWDLDPAQAVGKLSVGQRQKLACILALGHDPELLILDEPVASLDPAARRQFVQELIERAQDERHSVLFSTHIMSDVERVASHVAILVDGQVEFMGELDELKDRMKRVRLTRSEPFPANMSCPEAMRTVVEGPHLVLSIDKQRIDPGQLAARYTAMMEIEDLNLEEIFLEICGQNAADGTRQQMTQEQI